MVPCDDEQLSEKRRAFFQPLLAPISADAPTGENVRAGGPAFTLYHTMRSKRNEARSAERKLQQFYGDPRDAPPPPDWRPVYELAPKILAQHSKDLEVVACYIDALVRQHGFDGLRNGLRLARRLIEEFGDHLYPLPDEDELSALENERRKLAEQYPEDESTVEAKFQDFRARAYGLACVQPLRGLLDVLSGAVQSIPITEGQSRAGYSLVEYQIAARNGMPNVNDSATQSRLEAGELFLDKWQADALKSSTRFWQQRHGEIDDCLIELAALSDLLDERLGQMDAPSTADVRHTLEACRDVSKKFVTDPAASAPVTETGSTPAVAVLAEGAVVTSAALPPIDRSSREALLKQILEIADHFEKTEPHSPMSFHLRRVVRWGGMKLPDLLDEIVASEDARKQLYELIGIHTMAGDK